MTYEHIFLRYLWMTTNSTNIGSLLNLMIVYFIDTLDESDFFLTCLLIIWLAFQIMMAEDKFDAVTTY